VNEAIPGVGLRAVVFPPAGIMIGKVGNATNGPALCAVHRSAAPQSISAKARTAMTAVHARDGQPEAFAVSVERHGWRTTVTVRGELDLATVPALEPVLIAHARRAGLVIMDLGAVSFIDASGLGLLLRIDAHARRDGIELQLAPSSSVLRLLELWPPRDPLHVRHPAA
jgi:anti-sigma B factor antagonist